MTAKNNLLKVFSVIAILAMTFSNVQPHRVEAQSGDGLNRQVNAESGRVSFITPADGKPLSAVRALGESIRPQDPAMALAVRYAPEFGVKEPQRSLTAMESNRSDDGRLTVRFQQNYENVPVMGGELIVNTNDNGDLYSISGEVSPRLSISTQPTIDANSAQNTAIQAMAKWYEKTPEDFVSTEPELWIYDESLLQPSTRPVELTWRMEITPKDNGMPVRELVLVNAQRGSISLHFNQIDTMWKTSGKNDDVPTPTPEPTETPLPVTETPLPPVDAQALQTTQEPPAIDAGVMLYVSNTGNDANTCQDSASPCATIDGAIGKAASGATIQVATGTYTAPIYAQQVVNITKNIILSGGWNADFTLQNGKSIIDGQKDQRPIVNNSDITADLSSFIIRNSDSSGIWNNGNLSVSDSVVENNPGDGIYNNYGTLSLTRSSVINNTSGIWGGGIYNNEFGILEITNSTIQGNTLVSGDGGGIFNRGTLAISNSIVSHNKAGSGSGGGIYSRDGNMTISNTAIFGNTASYNGGGVYIYSSNATLDDTTIHGNTAGQGAGIANTFGGVTVLNNATVSNNVAYSSVGGIKNDGTLKLKNTIVGGNTAAGSASDCSGTLTSNGNNIISTTSGCTFTASAGDKVNINPVLGILLPSYGFQPLLPGSPAVNAGNPATCLPTDQRGMARVGICDIGAYEYTVPGAAATLVVVSGDGQRSSPGAAFPGPFQAAVLDGNGSPVPNVSVTFTAPGSGASGTFAATGTNTTTVLTDAGGIATTSAFTANNQSGSYLVTASSSGLASVTFSLQNIVFFVSPSGNDANSCTASTSPCATIRGALGKAQENDTIRVAEGVYVATAPGNSEIVWINKAVTLSGGWNATFTSQTGYSTIDGQNLRGTVLVEDYDSAFNSITVTISRFIIKNSTGQGITSHENLIVSNSSIYDNKGGGIGAASLTISNCSVYNNLVGGIVATYVGTILSVTNCDVHHNTGNGISSEAPTTSITSSRIHHNSGSGVSVYGEIALTMSNDVIYYNSTSSGGGGVQFSGYGGAGTISNTTISNNTASSGGGITTSTNPGKLQLINVTISENHATQSGGGISDSTLGASLINSILANNTAEDNSQFDSGNCGLGSIQLDGYSIVYPGNCGYSGTPRFIDPQLGLFIPSVGYAPLLAGSPAIDTGNPGTCTATDQRGISRVGTCDVGAYEYTIPGTATRIAAIGEKQRAFPLTSFARPLVVAALDAQGSPVSNVSITFTAPGGGASGTFASTGTNTETVLTDAAGYATTSLFTANSQIGPYTVTASSGAFSPLSFSLENGGLWYVSPSGNDANVCYTKEAPCQTINVAIGKAVNEDVIFVAAGTYTGSAGSSYVVSINKDLSLLGGWDNTFASRSGISIIDGQNSHPGVLVSMYKKAVIDSFTVQNGYSGVGGGIIVEGSLILKNSTVHSNSTYGSMEAGGITVDGSLVTENVTIANNSNSASYGAGGLYVAGGTVTLRNTILANNNASTNPDCKGTIRFSDHSLIGKKTSGCTVTQRFYDIFDVNPRLGSLTAGIYPLLFGSPAIDTGSYSACLPRDQRDVIRPQGASCDMGAYEYVFERSDTGILIATYNGNHSTTLPGTLVCNQTNPTCSNGDTHAKAAHQYAIGTYNLYKSKHGRASIDNNGSKINSTVHYSSGYANAFWNGYMMVYGDKYGYPLADDVVAHELAHGVTQFESNLFYYYQSGAINESFSDLWGEYYDQTNALGNDSAGVKWILGENISGYPIPSGFSVPATRSFSNPPALGDPDKMSSTYYYEGGGDNGGVHINSGVNNKAVYLMVQGGTFNNRTVTPLGWEKVAAIYYEANTNLLTSASDYSDLYYALQTACAGLLGQKGLVAADCTEVKDAIDAVEMNAQPATNFNTEAAQCPIYGTYPQISFSDDLEEGAGNWAFDNGTYPRWQYDSPYGLFAQSGQHSLYADDYPQNDLLPTDARTTLVSFTVPADGYLWFAQAYDFEYDSAGYYDGGVLEYSKDNGVTWTDAAPLIQSNGYKGKVYSDYGNPLAYRSAFVGSSHGYISTRLNLASLAGKSVSFRWRMGLDGSLASWGWWVDSVQVYTCQATTFADVPFSHPYYNDIEILYANNLTGGCQASPLKFCPDQVLNRGQAAAFMLRGNFGPSYVPPTPTHIFKDDWSKGPWAEGWAEGMRSEGFSAGCLANPLKYCPWDQIPREQAAIFALKLKYGKDYMAPPATGTVFADMTNVSYYATPGRSRPTRMESSRIAE